MSIDGVVRWVCTNIDSASKVTTDTFRCILIFCTKRKIGNHLQSTTPSFVILSVTAWILSASVTNVMTFGWFAWIIPLKRECAETLAGSSMICGHCQTTLRQGPEVISVFSKRFIPDGMTITTWTWPFWFLSTELDTTWWKQVFDLPACFLCDDTICGGVAGVDTWWAH